METFNHEGATITFALDCYTLCPVEDGGAVAITEVSDYAITEMRGFLPAEDDGTLYHEYEYTVRIHTDDRRFRVVVDRAKVAEEYGIDGYADFGVFVSWNCNRAGGFVAWREFFQVFGTSGRRYLKHYGKRNTVSAWSPGADTGILARIF